MALRSKEPKLPKYTHKTTEYYQEHQTKTNKFIITINFMSPSNNAISI